MLVEPSADAAPDFEGPYDPYAIAKSVRDLADEFEKTDLRQLNTLDIVFASDRKFLPYTGVTLYSLLSNYRGSLPLRVFILTDEAIPAEFLERFDAMRSVCDFSLEPLIVDPSDFANLRTTPGISVATYFRLKMETLLPDDVSFVIYLDSDLLILKSLSEMLWSLPEDKVLFGVEDSRSLDYVRKFSQHPDTMHINAGVLMFDIKVFRRLNFQKWYREYIQARKYLLMLGDQEIITSIFGLVIGKIDLRWNVHGSMFDPKWVARTAGVFNGYSPDEITSAASDPAIIHYTYHRKPWMGAEHPRAEMWIELAKKTPFRSLIF